MSRVDDGASLGRLAIPETQDTLSTYGGDGAQTREGDSAHAADLAVQLKVGTRAVDVRVAVDGKTPKITHGTADQKTGFEEVPKALGAFRLKAQERNRAGELAFGMHRIDAIAACHAAAARRVVGVLDAGSPGPVESNPLGKARTWTYTMEQVVSMATVVVQHGGKAQSFTVHKARHD
ncbi:PI-PLC domain-containing protein [Streptomyces rimosus]|uniref:hypothetical protein n=1 Tax=Streptomyces rimosus TaxID=1927 RepID=UPI0013318A2B|nr:hypothetical protein [Streptomyces rimosus]